MNLKIYQYDKCSTCRSALSFLRQYGVQFTLLPIREQPPSKTEIKRMLSIYEGDLRRLFNTSGRDYKSMNLKSKLPTMTPDEAIQLLASNGNLIKRPFALSDLAGRVGFREEDWMMFIRPDQ